MTKIAIAISTAIGLQAVLVVYLAFLAHELVQAGRSNAALGIGTFVDIAARPAFLITAGLAFTLAFYKVAH